MKELGENSESFHLNYEKDYRNAKIEIVLQLESL